MTQENLLKMKLHETKLIGNSIKITRVYNGWIYSELQQEGITSTFVPECHNVDARVHDR